MTEFSSVRRVPTFAQDVSDVRVTGAQPKANSEQLDKRKVQKRNASSETAIPFRPLLRPPMVVICIFDDGSHKGENIRLRSGSFTIGRSEGDLVISHDVMLSARHVKIEQDAENPTNWFVHDLNSTNGTFALVDQATLKPGLEVLLGSNRYRFEPSSATNLTPQVSRKTTTAWQLAQTKTANHRPALVPMSPDVQENLLFPADEFSIGSAPSEPGITITDPFLSTEHARVHLDNQNHWILKNCSCTNGVWIRISRPLQITKSATFQVGEQRFSVRIP